jgi:hypothetical protein
MRNFLISRKYAIHGSLTQPVILTVVRRHKAALCENSGSPMLWLLFAILAHTSANNIVSDAARCAKPRHFLHCLHMAQPKSITPDVKSIFGKRSKAIGDPYY